MAYNPNQQPPQYSQPNPYGQQQQPGYQQPGYQPPPGQYGQPPMPMQGTPLAQQLGPTSIGLDANIAGALSYFWIIGLIFFFIEKKNRFVRFHAFQALAWGIAIFVVAIILDYLPYVFFVGSLLHIAWLVGAIYAAVQAYNGKMFKLPVVGDMAEKNANNWVPMADGMGMNQPPMGGGYPPQQPGYPPQQPGYPPQPGTQYPQQPGQYPPPNQYPPQYPQQ
ncbi:MAG TPA: DUF4870 domain-containing protein [Ktedonobacterales bacterium]|jgi:uncharacterized membrane protein